MYLRTHSPSAFRLQPNFSSWDLSAWAVPILSLQGPCHHPLLPPLSPQTGFRPSRQPPHLCPRLSLQTRQAPSALPSPASRRPPTTCVTSPRPGSQPHRCNSSLHLLLPSAESSPPPTRDWSQSRPGTSVSLMVPTPPVQQAHMVLSTLRTVWAVRLMQAKAETPLPTFLPPRPQVAGRVGSMASHHRQAGVGPAGAAEGGCHEREEGSGGHADHRGEAGPSPRAQPSAPTPAPAEGPWDTDRGKGPWGGGKLMPPVPIVPSRSRSCFRPCRRS